MAPALLVGVDMRNREIPPRSGERGHGTPVPGHRRRPTKVRPVPARIRRGGRYETGVAGAGTGSRWVDEGAPTIDGRGLAPSRHRRWR
jgi:hypothetical protein